MKNVKDLSRRDLAQLVDTIFDALRGKGKVELYLPSRTALYKKRQSELLKAYQEIIEQAEKNGVLNVLRVPFF